METVTEGEIGVGGGQANKEGTRVLFLHGPSAPLAFWSYSCMQGIKK